MTTIGLATCRRIPNLTDDDRLLAEALRGGANVRPVVWNDAAVDWRCFAAVVLRSCWDYHLRPREFGDWLGRVEAAGVPLWNPAPLVRANMHKGYLRDLEAAGCPIVPTELLRQGTRRSLAAVLEARGWDQAVLKPAVSASAFRTIRVAASETAAAQADCDVMLADGDALVQRFMPEVAAGEWSLVFIDGTFSHGVLKRPAAGDFRVQNDFGGTAVAAAPAPNIVRAAEQIAASLARPWLFARVDGLEVDGRFLLMEVELIEPVLFFAEAPASAPRLAEALLRSIP